MRSIEEYERLHAVSEEELRGQTAKLRAIIAERTQRARGQDRGAARAASTPPPDPAERERIDRELSGADGKGGARGGAARSDRRSRSTRSCPRRSRRCARRARRLVGTHRRWSRGTRSTWNMVHYDVQLMGGIQLHLGKIAEMATGEGKTLVATLPLYLNALAGQGRAPRHGELVPRPPRLAVDGAPLHATSASPSAASTTPSRARRSAARRISRDITYGTNNEFGFDYLRDNMVVSLDQRVQRSARRTRSSTKSTRCSSTRRGRRSSSRARSATRATLQYREYNAAVARARARGRRRSSNALVAEARAAMLEAGDTRRRRRCKLYQAQLGAPEEQAAAQGAAGAGRQAARAADGARPHRRPQAAGREAAVPRHRGATCSSCSTRRATRCTSPIAASTSCRPSDHDAFLLPDISRGGAPHRSRPDAVAPSRSSTRARRARASSTRRRASG